MNLARIALALLFLGCWSVVAAQGKEAPKSVHQPELKQGQPTIKEEGKHVSVKELDAFHESIHPLVHELMPEKDFKGVRAKLPDLLKSAKAVSATKLPKALAAKQEAYAALGKQLVKQVTTLQKTKDNVAFEKLFDEMHMTFEEMMEMCAVH